MDLEAVYRKVKADTGDLRDRRGKKSESGDLVCERARSGSSKASLWALCTLSVGAVRPPIRDREEGKGGEGG